MNKHILPIAFATGLLALPAASLAAPPGQWFAGGQVGQSKLQGMSADHDTDTGYAVSGGYRWQVNPDVEIGPEVGYVTLGTFSDSQTVYDANTLTVLTTKTNAKVKGAYAGVNARFSLSPNWYAQLQGGYFNAHGRIDVRTTGTFTPGVGTYSMSSTKSSWYAGVGFGYRFSNSASLGLVINHFDDKTGNYDLGSSLASVRLEFQF